MSWMLELWSDTAGRGPTFAFWLALQAARATLPLHAMMCPSKGYCMLTGNLQHDTFAAAAETSPSGCQQGSGLNIPDRPIAGICTN